jgi:hypothetical protein
MVYFLDSIDILLYQRFLVYNNPLPNVNNHLITKM